jgi:hypothetical protein
VARDRGVDVVAVVVDVVVVVVVVVMVLALRGATRCAGAFSVVRRVGLSDECRTIGRFSLSPAIGVCFCCGVLSTCIEAIRGERRTGVVSILFILVYRFVSATESAHFFQHFFNNNNNMNVIDACLSLDHKSAELWDLVGARDWSSDYVDGWLLRVCDFKFFPTKNRLL